MYSEGTVDITHFFIPTHFACTASNNLGKTETDLKNLIHFTIIGSFCGFLSLY